MIAITTTLKMLVSSPRWMPGTGPIPLSPADAISKAQEWISAQHPDSPTFSVEGVSLQRCSGEPGFRFYLLDLNRHGRLAVLFNGTVIQQTAVES